MRKISALVMALLLASQSLFTALALTEQNYDFAKYNPLVEENFPLAREAAGEGIVLLENKNDTLPLAADSKVSLFGIGQIDYVAGGTGSGIINTAYKVNFLDGMLDAEKNGKLTVDSATAKVYSDIYDEWTQAVADAEEAGTAKPSLDEYALTDEDVAKARAESDTAVYYIRRIQGEGSDRKAVKGDYYISDIEASNLAKIDEAGFENFIIVINAGTAVDTSFFKDYETADSLIMAWLPGVEGGLALADVMTGDVNPSGKLTDTFLKSYDCYPSAESFTESQSFVNYVEDIYNGYRYFETFDPEYTMVNYEFGYGLSYTEFTLSGDSATVSDGNVNVSVSVKNTGECAGKEVIQVYYGAPQGLLGKSAKVLAGYAKTKLLAPGETQRITVTFPVSDMASFDDLGKTGNKSAYVLEAGDYNFYIGNSVRNAGERGIKGTYTVSETVVTQQLTSLLTPNALDKRLVAKEEADGSITAEYERLSVTTDADGSYKIDPNAAQTIIDAENYTDGTDGLETPVLPMQDNLKYVKGMKNGEYISFAFSNENAAMYTIALNISNGGEAVSPSFNIYLNDTLVCNDISVASTGSGTADGTFVFSETEFGLLVFEKGKSTVKIESANDGLLDIDSIILRPVTDLPVIKADKKTVIEAEKYDVAYNNPDDGNNMLIGTESALGETLVAKMQGKGNYIEYRFLVEKAGTYSFTFNYAATGNSSNPYSISINGEVQDVSYTLAKTSPEGTTSADGMVFYNTCAEAEPFDIVLPEGFVTMRLTTLSGSVNLNRYTFEKKFELPSGFTLVSGTENTEIEAENASAMAKGVWAEVKTIDGVETKVLNALTGEGKFLEYKLWFEKAGEYGVVFNVASTAGGTNPFRFLANGNEIAVSDYTFTKTTPEGATTSDTDAYYHTYLDMPAIAMEFPAGEVIFRLETTDTKQKPNFNKFTIKPVAEYEAEAPAGYRQILDTEPYVIQAESFDSNYNALSQKMNPKKLTEGDHSGETIMENIKTGSYLEYKVWFKYGGEYTVTYNYASTREFTSPYEIYINDEKLIRTENYTMSKTSLEGATWKDTYDFYFRFEDSVAIPYTFPQGSATLRISGENGGGSSEMPNLNYITITCVEADIPEITVPDGGEDEDEEEEEKEPEIPEDRLPDYTEKAEDAALIMYEDYISGKATLDEFVAQLTNLDLIRLAGGHPPVNGCSSSMGRLLKYHIPTVNTGDGGAGIRTGADAMTTWWPCSTMLACTWNTDLIRRVGNAVGLEGKRLRWDTWLAPGLNIHRNPLCGRNFEYYSEDPLVSGICAAEITIGARAQGMHTVPKHFAVNNKESGRSISDSRLSERALREIYLKGFEILVKKAQPRYIMTSYNLINGTEAAESYDLQTAILRNEWGFEGITMTDWNNGNSRPAKEIKAGSNIRMPYGEINELVKDLYDGDITREELKANAKQILPVLADSMAFEGAKNPYTVNRDSDIYIPVIHYSYVNDDNFGVVTNDFTSSDSKFYSAGDYFEYHSWAPNLTYSADGGVALNIWSKTVTANNVDFEDDTLFLAYNIDVKESGSYKIYLFTPQKSQTNTIYVDDVKAGDIRSGKASRDETYVRSEALTVNLTKGSHTIKLGGIGSVERLCITPDFTKEQEAVDGRIFTKIDSEWGLKFEKMSDEIGTFNRITVDPEDTDNMLATDHWSIATDETVYPYLAFCYRTNYDGVISAKGQRSGQTTGDTTEYKFTADKTDAWTTSVIKLTGSGDDTMFRQLHFYPFGKGKNHAATLEKNYYFDLYHFGFFKTEADALAYCRNHAPKAIKGNIILERDIENGYYDDALLGYAGYAEISLLDSNGKTVSKFYEYGTYVSETDGKATIGFTFDAEDGDYTLVVRKPGYAEKQVPITVENGTAHIDDIHLLAGDITASFSEVHGDGIIDIDDFIRILRAFAQDADERIKIYTDINEDGLVNVSDIAILKKNFGK